MCGLPGTFSDSSKRSSPKENRGLREAPLQLLEDVKVPSVVVEMAFATSPDNKRKLLDEKVQQDIARALAKGIRDSL